MTEHGLNSSRNDYYCCHMSDNCDSRERERAELHKTILTVVSCLSGSANAWDFKQYIFGMLFYRFISENLTDYINRNERKNKGDENFDYAKISDEDAEFYRADTVKEKGFYILPSELFINVRKKAKDDKNLNETLSSVFRNIENSAKAINGAGCLKGLFDDIDLNSNKLGDTVEKRNQKLVKILDAIGDLKLSNGNYHENNIDAFGDAYEFLISVYTSNSGKTAGEFFTPQEVSELVACIATVGKKEVNKVYDPSCGSGSLLLKFVKILGKGNVKNGFFGQEINFTTYNLCRMNMFLHDINYNHFNIAHGDTLTEPKHLRDAPFDAIVSNPPYSVKWEGDSNPLLIHDARFAPAGVLAPKSKADLAFVMHVLHCLSASGTAAIVSFPGVLYRGGAEQKIRQYLIDNNNIDAVIQLPPDLFFGTCIATCILVLKKNKKDNSILFIDASNEFVRSGDKNKLTEENRKKILDAYIKRQDIDHFAKLVSHQTIAENDYNIAVSTYVVPKDTREEIDIHKLNAEIKEIEARKQKLIKAIDEAIKELES